MIYSLCTMLLLIGILGLLAQTLLGTAHTGHHGHAGHHGHHGGGRRGAAFLLTLLSPLTFFSLCLGTGATGLLLKHLHLPSPAVAAMAALGGLFFYGAIIRPVWNLIFQFASTPSRALEGMVAGEAEAISGFDGAGKGLVRLTIDGQIVRVLATLEADERTEANAIRPGDRLTVTSVDGRTNSCRVARL